MALSHMQVRSNAPDADIIVLGMPANVNAALGRPAAYLGNLTAALADLQGSGFQKLSYLAIPASVMQVPGLPAQPFVCGSMQTTSCRQPRLSYASINEISTDHAASTRGRRAQLRPCGTV